MQILDYLASDNYIIVNKTLIKTFGLNEAILMGELCSEYKYWKKEDKLEDGMFFSTIENIEENTGLTAYEQRKAIKSLENAGVLTTELKGIPAKKYFGIDVSTVIKILTSCDDDFSQQDAKKLHSNNNNNNNNKKLSISKDIDNANSQSKSESKSFLGSIKKPKKDNLYSHCVSVINSKCTDEGLRNKCITFLDSLVEQKKLKGKSQFDGIMNKLFTLSNNDTQTMIDMLDYSIEHGYCTVYEKKNYKKDTNVARDIEHSAVDHVPHVSDDPEYEERQRQFIEKCKREGIQYEF